jgi:hypothetical protein
MGRGIVEAGLGRTERLELEQRTSDPATTQQGEMWLRTDLAPATDQIATVRVDNGSGTWDVPVFDASASTTNVEKVLRLPVGGTVGFVPTTASGGAFSDLRLQHSGSTLQWHDSLEASVIPDSGDHQWHIDEGSGTTLNDSVGSVTATINGATWQAESGPVGGQFLSHDGVDDYWVTDSALSLDQATLCGWVRPNDFTSFGNQLVSWGNNIDEGDRDGFYLDTEDADGEVLVVMAGGSNGSSVHRNVSFAGVGSWGFYAINYDGGDVRLITFDNSSELADVSASATDTASGSHAIYGGGNPTDGRHADADTDFTVAATNRTLTKTEITDLWEATKR